MRYLSFCAGFILFAVCTLASADTNQRDYAVSFGYGAGNTLTFKKTFSESDSFQPYVEAGFGATHASYSNAAYGTTTSYNSSSQTYSASLGTRYFLQQENFVDYIFLALTQSYAKYSYSGVASGAYPTSVRSTQATLGYGLEYFLNVHLSLEASAGLQFAYTKTDNSVINTTQKTQSFPGVRTAVTYYW